VAKSPPDGYTLLVQASTFVATALLMDKLPYDISKDFTPVTNLGAVPLVVTCFPGIPAKDLREFVSAIRAQPNKYVFGTSAVGSASHLAQAAIRFQAKLDFTIVPYKGTAPALADVMGGHISAMVDALPSTMPHVKSGKLRALAVTARERLPEHPDVPAVAETFAGFDFPGWWVLAAPTGVPVDVVERVNKEMHAILNDPEVVERMGKIGFASTRGGSLKDVGDYIQSQHKAWGTLVKEIGLQPE